jgi:hypothetical protein
MVIYCPDSQQSSVMKHCQEPRCVTGISHLKKAGQRLKTCDMLDSWEHLNEVNAEQIDGLIKNNHHIMVCEFAVIMRISACSVKIINDKLNFSTVSASWVPKLLSNEQKARWFQISTYILDSFERKGDPLLNSVVICDKMWVHYFVPQTKRASMEGQHIKVHLLKGINGQKFLGLSGHIILRFSDRTMNSQWSLHYLWIFLKPNYSQPFIQNYTVYLSNSTVSFKTTGNHTLPLWHYKHWRKCNKILLGKQPHQMYKRNWRFENHLSPHHQGCDMIPEPTVPYIYIAPQAICYNTGQQIGGWLADSCSYLCLAFFSHSFATGSF